MAAHHRKRNDRGSALLISVILVLLMAVVGLALVSRSTSEVDAVGAKRNYDVAVSCADGAREMLMSSFTTFGASPTSLSLDKTVGDKRLTTGHYDSFALQSVVATAGSGTGAVGATDIVNRTSRARLGGQVYRMTVVCTDSTAPTRQSEVEFVVRFGL